jgi:hypothetical protein
METMLAERQIVGFTEPSNNTVQDFRSSPLYWNFLIAAFTIIPILGIIIAVKYILPFAARYLGYLVKQFKEGIR